MGFYTHMYIRIHMYMQQFRNFVPDFQVTTLLVHARKGARSSRRSVGFYTQREYLAVLHQNLVSGMFDL